MGAEYILTVGCEFKQHFSDDAWQRTKELRRYESMVEYVQNQAPPDATVSLEQIHKITTQMHLFTADGGRVSREVTIGELYRQTLPLRAWEDYCSECPYAVLKNQSGKGIVMGCYGEINYPLSQAIELLVSETLESVLATNSGPALRLLNWVEKLGPHTPHSDARRARDQEVEKNQTQGSPGKRLFFQSDSPLRVKKPDSEGSISTDQILDHVLGESAVIPGVVASEVFYPFFSLLVTIANGSAHKRQYINDRSIGQFLTFTEACRLAGVAGCDLMIDT